MDSSANLCRIFAIVNSVYRIFLSGQLLDCNAEKLLSDNATVAGIQI